MTHTMKAWRNHKYGGAEVLVMEEVPKPVPVADEILVRVYSTSVNRTDCANVRAHPAFMRLSMGLFRPRNTFPGTEFAGVVESVGHAVHAFKVGDRVFGFSDAGLRSWSEYLTIGQNGPMALMPEGMSFRDAGGCIEGFHYAYNFYNKVELKKGDHVLVIGAAGGIGSAAVQILMSNGILVTGVSKSSDMTMLQDMGLTQVIDYAQEDFASAQVTYDGIFDCAGKSRFRICENIINHGGFYISSELGPKAENVWLSLVSAVLGSIPFRNDKSVKFPYPPGLLKSIHLFIAMYEKNSYKPAIDRRYAFEDLPDAFSYVDAGHKSGNVLVTVAEV